jgi:hypothetical protein
MTSALDSVDLRAFDINIMKSCVQVLKCHIDHRTSAPNVRASPSND